MSRSSGRRRLTLKAPGAIAALGAVILLTALALATATTGHAGSERYITVKLSKCLAPGEGGQFDWVPCGEIIWSEYELQVLPIGPAVVNGPNGNRSLSESGTEAAREVLRAVERVVYAAER